MVLSGTPLCTKVLKNVVTLIRSFLCQGRAKSPSHWIPRPVLILLDSIPSPVEALILMAEMTFKEPIVF